MTKAELITALSERSDITKKDADTYISAVIDIITETLAKGERVQIVGFGSFEVRERAAREGVNPQTREKMTIPASKVPSFKAGRVLREAIV